MGYKVQSRLIWTTKVRPSWWKPWANTVAYYPLNWNANDYSWNGKNGTASNITWNSWWDGGCASFNGSNSYINVPALSITNNLTISCWIKTTQSSIWEIIQMVNSAWTQSFEFRVSSWKLNLWLWNSWYSEQGWNSSSSINTWQWVNVIVTKSGNNYNLYINSVNDGVFTSSLWIWFNNNRIWLHTNGSNSPYNWLIDNFIIENKARTASEIADYYNLTKSNYWL